MGGMGGNIFQEMGRGGAFGRRLSWRNNRGDKENMSGDMG